MVLRLLRFSPLLCVFLLAGCSTISVKPTGRAASDQMLVALSMEDAVRQLKIEEHLFGKKVDLQVHGLGIDMEYVAEVFKAKIRRAGGRIVPTDATPDLALHVMVQTTGSDQESTKWSFPLALPSISTGLTVSKIDFYNNDAQVARARMWVYGTDRSQNVLFDHPPVYAAHYVSNPELFGISFGKRSDVQELRKREGTGAASILGN